MSLDLESVVQLAERYAACDIGNDLLQALLETIRNLNVLNNPAADTHEMVVVPAQPLCQFVAGESRRREMGGEHPGLLEDGERSV